MCPWYSGFLVVDAICQRECPFTEGPLAHNCLLLSSLSVAESVDIQDRV